MSNSSHEVVTRSAAEAPEAYGSTSSRESIDIAGYSHEGKLRSRNEDHFLSIRFGRILETLDTNIEPRENIPNSQEIGYAILVADGLGGHAAGEVASKLAINTIIDLVLNMPDWVLRYDDEEQTREAIRRARDLYEKVDEVVAAHGMVDSSFKGMATTLTLVWSIGRDLFVCNVGDSRAYLLSEGRLRQLTRDHTVTQELVDRGELTVDEASKHDFRHVLTNAVGNTIRKAVPEIEKYTLIEGDCLMLCTDGLSDMVSDDLISETLAGPGSSHELCQRLFTKAMDAGGKDNITVVVAQYHFAHS